MSGNRRQFFRQTGWAMASALGFPAVVRSSEAAWSAPDARPRHIIHLVSDGTSLGTLTLGDHFARLQRQRSLRWFDLYQRPGAVGALVNMRSLNSFVTDSAAASSSWGSGSRVVNGVLNQLPGERDLFPLYRLFAQAGWRRGLVTTTEITHATPAGFVANCSNRGSAQDIARQYLERRVEVLLGGGRVFFDPGKRKDKRDLRRAFREAGYTVMDVAADLDAAPLNRPWLGTFAKNHLPYTLDQNADHKLMATVPTLAAMTTRALAWLSRCDHFILQVEGGRVDHAAHNCDIAGAVRDLLAFDDALEVCLEFQRRVPETLLLITTDHGTANPGLNGAGTAYKDSPALFLNSFKVGRSLELLAEDLKPATTVAVVQKTIRAATGYTVSETKAALLLATLAKKSKSLYDHMNSTAAQLGQLLGNHLGVGWTGTAHTADYVPLLAVGPGAIRFGGFIQNTDVFRGYLALAGIDYRNPEASLLVESGPTAAEAEGLMA
jgi:alkaline phosphatase